MAQRQIQLTKAVFYMTGAIASFVAMAVAGRAVSFQLDTFEIMLFRSFIGFLLVLGFILVRAKAKIYRGGIWVFMWCGTCFILAVKTCGSLRSR